MDFDLSWLLLLVPGVFALGWWASRLDLRQARRDPRDAPQAYFKGLNLLLNEQHDKAIDAFIEAVQLDPDTIELHFALGNLFRRRGETERAVRVHEHLLARADLPESERARARHALAQDFFKAGLFDRAEDAFLQLKGSPYELEAELALLSLYERSQDWVHAGEIAERLEARGTGSFASRRAHYLCERAVAARAQGNHEAAEALLKDAQTLAPAHARSRMLEAQWQLAEGDAANAMGSFERLLLLSPTAFALAAADYAKAASLCQQELRAIQHLEQHYALEPALALVLALNQLDPGKELARLQNHLQHHASLNAAKGLLSRLVEGRDDATALMRAMDGAAKPLRRHRCAACGFEATHYFWQCPGCLSWDSFPPRPVEEL